eukprot:m.77166 g.77166  ORF g.77166 m.77166 type:complete len:259 (+) comp12607_c0_seq1:67-843(+)
MAESRKLSIYDDNDDHKATPASNQSQSPRIESLLEPVCRGLRLSTQGTYNTLKEISQSTYRTIQSEGQKELFPVGSNVVTIYDASATVFTLTTASIMAFRRKNLLNRIIVFPTVTGVLGTVFYPTQVERVLDMVSGTSVADVVERRKLELKEQIEGYKKQVQQKIWDGERAIATYFGSVSSHALKVTEQTGAEMLQKAVKLTGDTAEDAKRNILQAVNSTSVTSTENQEGKVIQGGASSSEEDHGQLNKQDLETYPKH